MTQATLLARTVALAATALLLAGCGTTADATPPPPSPSASASESAEAAAPSPFEEGSYYSATATRSLLDVHDAPGGARVSELAHPNPTGAPLTLLIKDLRDDWLEVYLPARPNGATGWILARSVDVKKLAYRIEVSTSTNELTVYESDEVIHTYAVATGTGGTPTPLGTFYLTELLAPTNAGYGPYAYGLSAFSEVLSEFGGGPGQIGLHGTNDESSIGQAVSHGCIRLSNADITTLAGILPLGTPIEIIA